MQAIVVPSIRSRTRCDHDDFRQRTGAAQNQTVLPGRQVGRVDLRTLIDLLDRSHRLVLRLVTDDSNAVCRFSMKFGADMNTARRLLEKARDIDLEIIGVR